MLRIRVVLFAVLVCSRYLQAFQLPLSRLLSSAVSHRWSSVQMNSGPYSDQFIFLSAMDKGLRDSNVKSISLYDARNSRTSATSDLKLLNGVRRIDGRLVTIRSATKLQLTHKYQHNEQAKNYDIMQAGQYIKSVLDSGVFRQASMDTPQLVHKLRVGGTDQAPTYRLVSRTKESSTNTTAADAALHTHDRTKAGFVSVNEPFLGALGITYTDKGAKKKVQSPAADASHSGTSVPTARPRVGMADKLHQIQKYVEILDGLVKGKYNSATTSGAHPRSAQPLHILDMGCGLAYLTFAVHSHFRKQFPALRTTGIEARPALVQQTESIARSLGPDFSGLHFQEGQIMDLLHSNTRNSAECKKTIKKMDVNVSHDRAHGISADGVLSSKLALPTDPAPVAVQVSPVDILLALHACDTATDDAIYYGIYANASIIVVAPCCHKQLRPQLDAYARKLLRDQVSVNSAATTDNANTNQITAALSEVLSHGIYRERQAEMVTDTLRAMYLQYAGYETKVFEFVSGAHTAKNIMITATRSAQKEVLSTQEKDNLWSRIQDLKSAYGIREHKLEQLLNTRQNG